MGEISVGSTVAGYRIDGLIARGGMGVVYRATHLGLERPVALKVIARELVGRPGFRERFQRESRLAARLDHPAVVPIFDSREVEGELLVAMRLIEGGDLRRLIDRDGPLEPARALDLLAQVADALDAAHAAGIVHRDVKPHNVLVEGERAFLSDFGLAKALDESGAGSAASVVGTAAYMSPEQWRGEAVGPAADVYSLGCVLYESLTGIAPFARLREDAEPQMPEGLDDVIERAVAAEPARRYASAGELIEAARLRQSSDMRPTAVLGAEDRAAHSSRHRAAGRGSIFSRRRGLSGGSLARAGAALLLLAGIGAAALLLLSGGGVQVSEPVPVATPPLRLSAGPDSVWATSERDGTLIRLDPESGAPLARARLGRGISGVAVGGRWVWVTDPRRGEVLRVDPATRRVVERIELRGRPGPIALGGNRAWVADEGGAGVTAINALGGRVARADIVPHAAPLRLAVGSGGVWVTSASTGSVRRIDLGSTAPGRAIVLGGGPAGLAIAGGVVWVARARADSVVPVDALSRVVGEPIEVGDRPGGIDAGTSTVWVANAGEDSVARIDVESGELLGEPIAVGPRPGAVAVGADAVWVANNGDGTVTRIEP